MGLHKFLTLQLDGKKIWFTEWVENNIGVVDTSIPLTFSIDTDKERDYFGEGADSSAYMLKIAKTLFSVMQLMQM